MHHLAWNSRGYLTHIHLTIAMERWEVWYIQAKNLQNTNQQEQYVEGSMKEGSNPTSLTEKSQSLPSVIKTPQKVWIMIILLTMVSHCPMLIHIHRRQMLNGVKSNVSNNSTGYIAYLMIMSDMINLYSDGVRPQVESYDQSIQTKKVYLQHEENSR